METVLAAILGPLVTALVGALGVVLRGLRMKRQDLSDRKRNIQVAGQTVAFIDAYLSAQQKLSPGAVIATQVTERATRDLEQAYAGMMQVAAADHAAPSGLVVSELFKRAMLRSVRRPAAKVVRAVFYLYLILGMPVLVSLISVMVHTPGDVGLVAFFSILVGIIMLLPAVALYWWARWLDRLRDPVVPPPASPPIWPGPTPREPWPSPLGLPSIGDLPR